MPARSPTRADPLARQAAEWIIRLSADEAAERAAAQAGFAAWKNADPRHAEAAARMERLVGNLNQVRGGGVAQPARRALNAALAGNRRLGRATRLASALLLAGLCILPAWVGMQARTPSYWLTDLRSGEGEWPETTLADGSTIALGSLSAVNVDFNHSARTVELVQGEILVDVAKDAARPFIVETAHGRIKALGTRFTVRREAEWTVVTMLESRVEVSPARRSDAAGDTPLLVSAGQQVRIGADGALPAERIDAPSVSQAWYKRQFVAQEMPLPDVLDELDRQRPGRIFYDRKALARIKVSAVLPLNDSDRAVQLLVNNFPELRVRTVTPYLLAVDLAPQAHSGFPEK